MGSKRVGKTVGRARTRGEATVVKLSSEEIELGITVKAREAVALHESGRYSFDEIREAIVLTYCSLVEGVG